MKRKYLPLGILALALCAVVIGAGEAHAANEDFVSTLVREFYNKTSNWEPTLKRYALGIFRWLVILKCAFSASRPHSTATSLPTFSNSLSCCS